MRSFLGLAISLLLVSWGCSEVEVHRCESSLDCHADAVCSMGYCMYDPLPRFRVVTSGDRARVGEEIRFDATGTFVPGGGPIELKLHVHPEDAAEVLPTESETVRALRMSRPHRSVEATLVARTGSGREARWTTAIAPVNSPPRVRLELPERIQPGESLRLQALVEDPDGDPVELEWSYEGEGAFVADGLDAELHLPEEEGWHRIEVRAHDGVDGSEAGVDFQPKNAPPRIVELIGPETVEHECDETSCKAFAHFEVVADDVGPLRYSWRFQSDLEGEARFEGGSGPSPKLILETYPTRPIAGTYRVEVQVRDDEDAIAIATRDFTVTNRPPRLKAHDGSVIHHEHRGQGRYRWHRPSGSVGIWEDPDGDVPLSVEWSSPDPRVRFSHPNAIDPGITIEGDESLLGARLPVEVVARDMNGGEASAKAVLELGNRPPELTKFEHGPLFYVVGDARAYVNVKIGLEDPDGDPLETTVVFHPDDEPPAGLAIYPTAEGVKVEGYVYAYSVRLLVTARDTFGAVYQGVHTVTIGPGERT